MYTECSQFQFIIINVESVRSPHMFLLSTLYPTFYCGSGRTKVRPFLFFVRIGAQAGIEWFASAEGAQCAPGVRLKKRRGKCPCFTGWDAACAAASRARGGLAPSCGSPPPGEVRGCPRPQTNLSTFCGKICFAIISRRFGFAPNLRGGGADDVRFMFIVSVKATLRPGTDAPLWGGSQPPACRNSRWVADGRRH